MQEKKKILFVTPYSKSKGLKTSASSGCGAEESMLILLEKLDRTRYEPVVIYPLDCFYKETREADARDKLEKLGIEYFFFPMSALQRRYHPFKIMKDIVRLFSLTFRLFKLIKEKDIDLVYINTSQILAGGLAARLGGIPSVYHVRQLIAEPRIFRKILAKILNPLADRIISISTAVGEMFWENGISKDKCINIFNGVDLNRYPLDLDRQKIKGELKLDPDTKLVGMVARMDPRKGHIYFLEAAQAVLKEFSSVKFLIVGDIDSKVLQGYKTRLIRLTEELGLKEKVVFFGSRGDIPAIMAALDILVMPSCSEKSPEPFGRVLIEAMAAKTPVIATRDGGATDIVVEGVTGLLIPPRDSEAIARGVLSLIRDPSKAEQMGTAGRRRAEVLFSAREYVRKIENIFEELLASEGAIQKKRQMAYFNEKEMSDLEINRPHRLGAFYNFIIDYKMNTAIELLGPSLKGVRVINICCGSGMEAEFLVRRGARVVGVDISIGALKGAKKRAEIYGFNLPVVVGDAENLPFVSGCFDYGFSHDGLHHLAQPKKGILELSRVANKGIVLIEPASALFTKLACLLRIAKRRESSGNLVYRFKKRELGDLFKNLGFKHIIFRRYLMYYPQNPSKLFSIFDLRPVMYIFKIYFYSVNALMARWGNKITAVARQ